MQAIKRDLGQAINNYLNKAEQNSNVLLLSGARQVGKTTLIKEMLKDKNAVILNLFESTTLPSLIDATETFEDFEKLLLRELNFRPSQGTILVFDEAQEAKRLARWIRFFKEKWINQKVIVLGSILSNLFEDGIAYPVGRVEEIVLRPFNFKEFLIAMERDGLREILETVSLGKILTEADHASLIKCYLDYLQTGGMPEIVLKIKNGLDQPYAAWDKLLRQYALDVERYMEEIYKTMFVSALDRIADITCHPIKNSQIISTDSPSYRKLPHLLEILEKWHLVHKVPAQTKHPESAGGLASKRYLFDVGLINFFINHSQRVSWLDRPQDKNHAYAKLQEAFVCNEILSSSPHPLNILNYYKETRNSKEIDFLVNAGGRIIPIEVKSQSSISKNTLAPMLNFLKNNGLKDGILIYNGPIKRLVIDGKNLHAIPAYALSTYVANL